MNFLLQKHPVDVNLSGAGVYWGDIYGAQLSEFSNVSESQADSWAVFLIRSSTAYVS